MHLVLLLVAAVLAAVGVAILRSGLPVDDVPTAALFAAGMATIVSAIVVAALGVIARELARISERLEIQPLPLPQVASVGHEDPIPRPIKSTDPAAGAARPSLLGWITRESVPVPRAPPVVSMHDTMPVDLAPLARVQEPVAPPPRAEPLDPLPPRSERPLSPSGLSNGRFPDLPSGRPADLPASTASRLPELPPLPRRPESFGPPPPLPKPVQVRPIERPVAAPLPSVQNTVYRSGVIDGMAYTLFMDGSIEAELPDGTVKFASVDDLQKYLLGEGKAG
jgi:hypothetical protein